MDGELAKDVSRSSRALSGCVDGLLATLLLVLLLLLCMAALLLHVIELLIWLNESGFVVDNVDTGSAE